MSMIFTSEPGARVYCICMDSYLAPIVKHAGTPMPIRKGFPIYRRAVRELNPRVATHAGP